MKQPLELSKTHTLQHTFWCIKILILPPYQDEGHKIFPLGYIILLFISWLIPADNQLCWLTSTSHQGNLDRCSAWTHHSNMSSSKWASQAKNDQCTLMFVYHLVYLDQSSRYSDRYLWGTFKGLKVLCQVTWPNKLVPLHCSQKRFLKPHKDGNSALYKFVSLRLYVRDSEQFLRSSQWHFYLIFASASKVHISNLYSWITTRFCMF